jgi:hypothetical protein
MGRTPGTRLRTWQVAAVGVVAVAAAVAGLALSGWGPLAPFHPVLVSAHRASTSVPLSPAKALEASVQSTPSVSASASPAASPTPTPEPSASPSASVSASEDETDTETGDDNEMETETKPIPGPTPVPSASGTPDESGGGDD